MTEPYRPGEVTLNLTAEQRRRLHNALLSAFPNSAGLERMVRFQLDENLRAVVGGDSLSDVVFNLIEWTESQGRLAELIRGARAEVPGNPALREIAEELLGGAVPASSPDPGVPSDSGSGPGRKLSLAELARLVDAFLAVPSLSHPQTRQSIQAQLPPEIANQVPAGPTPRVEVLNLVQTCLRYPRGLDELLTVVKFFEGDSLPMQRVLQLVEELLPGSR